MPADNLMEDLEHLASLVEVSLPFVRGVSEHRIDAYSEFNLKKSDGASIRKIAAPIEDLAKIQRWILDNVLTRSRISRCSFAYQKNVSIKNCAEKHLGARWMVKLDLQDFFHHIDERQVSKIFRQLGYDDVLSGQLARVCTRRSSKKVPGLPKYKAIRDSMGKTEEYDCRRLGYLSQGSPTSGKLANIVAAELDRSLLQLAILYGLCYTRYSDDLVFSSKRKFTRVEALQIIRHARSEVAANGFRINEKKIKISPPGSRLIVLGLLVNGDSVRLTADFKNRLKWHVYGVKKFGMQGYSMSQGFINSETYIGHVDGLFHYAMDIEREWTCRLYTEWLTLKDFLPENALEDIVSVMVAAD